MPAQSQQQQKLFGLALSVKRGDTPRSEASKEILKIVDTMTEKEIEDFAGTDHEGLPKKVEQKIREMARQTIREQMIGEAKFRKGDMVRVVDNPKYVMDKKKFAGMSGYVKNTIGRDVQVTFPNGRTILVDPKDLEMNPNESVNEGKLNEVSFEEIKSLWVSYKVIVEWGIPLLIISTTLAALGVAYFVKLVRQGKNAFMAKYREIKGTVDKKEVKKAEELINKVKKKNESVNEDATQLWYQTIDMLDKNLKKGYDPTKIRNVNSIAGTLQKLFKGLPQRNAMDMATSYNDYKAGQKDKKQTVKDWVRILKKHQIKELVNEANGEFVVYIEKDNGRKKLLHTKKSQRAANMFMSKNMDKILNKSGIRSIGSMSKDQWEKKEAMYAENIKKSDMKTVTKKEWDRTHKDYKGMIKGQPYMMWFDKKTQSTVYGPVHIKESVNEAVNADKFEKAVLNADKLTSNIYLGTTEILDSLLAGMILDKGLSGAKKSVKELTDLYKSLYESVNETKDLVRLVKGRTFDLGRGNFPTGLVVYNRAETKNGDFKQLAHISHNNNKITYYDKKLPTQIKSYIETLAKNHKGR